MAHSADPRAIRTREKLVEAFRELAETADSGTITVSAIVAAAGVHRSVFYKHFASPDDLAIHLLRDLFGFISSADVLMRTELAVSGLHASRRAMEDVVRFLGAHRSTYAPLLGPGAPARAIQSITDAFAELTADALEQMSTRPPGVDPQTVSRFLAHGVVGVVGRWLDDPGGQSDAEVVEQLMHCFPAWLTAGPP